MVNKILIVGCSHGSCAIVEYAKSIGWYTIVAGPDIPSQSKPKQLADEEWRIDTSNIDQLEKLCRDNEVNAVISGVSEFNLEVAMELCRRLNLPCYCSPESWHFSKDKADFKLLCRKVGVPVPTDYKVSVQPTEKELNAIVYPVMVKPVDLSANRGVSYCYNKTDVIKAIELVRSKSSNPKIVVERMLHGEEWWAGYAIAEGHISLLSLNGMYSEPGMPKNCYSITSTISDHVQDFVKGLNPKIEKLLQAVGCKEGFAWVQLMLDEDGEFYVIEMGYRLTGEELFLAYKNAFGFDAIKWIVDFACGLKNSPAQLPPPENEAFTKCATAYSIWTKQDAVLTKIIGLNEVAKIPGVTVDFLKRPGSKVSRYSILGNILFAAEDVEETCRMIDLLNRSVRVEDAEGNDITIKFTDFGTLKKAYYNGLERR